MTIAGNQYKLDDIVFSQSPEVIKENHAPSLFKIGPLYEQLWQPKERFIFAEDKDLNLFLEKDFDGAIYFPHIKDDAGRDDRDPEFDLSTARIYQKNGQIQSPDEVNLQFSLTVGIGNESAPPCNCMRSIPTDPNNIPVLQIPRRETPRDLWVSNKDLHDGTVRAKTVHNKMYVLAHALKNSGYDVWPNVRIMKVEQGQLFENMVFTCTVSDGLSGDKEAFPVSVVNWPITNESPLIEDVKDQYFEIGKVGTYQITAYDPDQEDMLGLTFTATWLNRIPCWCYYCSSDFINPSTGTFSFVPQPHHGIWHEGKMQFMVIVSDPRGAYCIAEFTVFCIDPVMWSNHAPVIVREVDPPQTVRAGSLIMLPDFKVVDPDGDPLYYSCNIGSFTREGVYSLPTYFPGSYQITITAYDMRGGSVSQEFTLEVLPWWSY